MAGSKSKVQIYTLAVALTDSPPDAGPEYPTLAGCSLQIRGDQTLEALHHAIAVHFGRPADCSYEFQFEVGPSHPVGKRYVLPAEFSIDAASGSPAAGRVNDATLDSLGLAVGQDFSYWPDTGDDLWSPVRVEQVKRILPRGKYPKVTKQSDGPTHAAGGGEAVAMGPGEGADTASLVAELHLEKGEYHKAVAAFTRAIETQPTANAYSGRARAYRFLADVDEQSAQQLLSK